LPICSLELTGTFAFRIEIAVGFSGVVVDEVLSHLEMLKKAASGVLAILPCSRTPCTLRASKWLRPCWTDFFEHSLQLMMAVSSWACICHGNEIFNSPNRPCLLVGEKEYGRSYKN